MPSAVRFKSRDADRAIGEDEGSRDAALRTLSWIR